MPQRDDEEQRYGLSYIFYGAVTACALRIANYSLTQLETQARHQTVCSLGCAEVLRGGGGV